ncbi:MAG: deoxynucleoside kinase [Gammaproteobacteria bacterium]|nr:deoxynucleoside kinase [Gammaproteobacteria bacterium]MDH5801085.1 deoxynucleoside kinase [Gammaproteobacteria bacterium]
MSQSETPRYIVVEGPIGVGKTSLTKRLAESLQAQTLLEAAEENPFLERFYQDPKQGALPTQLFFLFQRARQLQELRQADMFTPVIVADFMMEKDRLFAELTLDDHELQLYDQVYSNLTLDAPKPDLVIYLQAPVNVLISRVQNRGRRVEQSMDPEYLEGLADTYTRFFHYYSDTPLLIVNAADIDLVNNDAEYELLLQRILHTRSGRQYFNPLPFDS